MAACLMLAEGILEMDVSIRHRLVCRPADPNYTAFATVRGKRGRFLGCDGFSDRASLGVGDY